jgi:hypothetical protein
LFASRRWSCRSRVRVFTGFSCFDDIVIPFLLKFTVAVRRLAGRAVPVILAHRLRWCPVQQHSRHAGGEIDDGTGIAGSQRTGQPVFHHR